jgi:putative transposase
VKFTFIRDLDGEEQRKPRKARIPVSLMCDVLDVSRSGFYAWLKRDRSDRQKDDAELTEVIKKIHEDHQGRLGVDRLVTELAKMGRRHSPRRIRRLARAAHLTCVHPRPYRATTIQDKANSDGLVDLVGREFVPHGPNQLWFTDMKCRRRHFMSYADPRNMPTVLAMVQASGSVEVQKVGIVA